MRKEARAVGLTVQEVFDMGLVCAQLGLELENVQEYLTYGFQARHFQLSMEDLRRAWVEKEEGRKNGR